MLRPVLLRMDRYALRHWTVTALSLGGRPVSWKVPNRARPIVMGSSRTAGYAANVGVLTALQRGGDVVFSDELNHASIIDGCRLSRAEITVFRHRDVAALEAALGAREGRRRIVVSESLFSMDGDLADPKYVVELLTQMTSDQVTVALGGELDPSRSGR